MDQRLASRRREAFETRGFIGPVPVASPEAMRGHRARLEAFEQAWPAHKGKLFQAPHLLFPWLFELLKTPPLLDALEALLGPDLLLVQCGFRIKEPGDSRYVAWHQDDHYIKIAPLFVTAVIAFSDNTPESGCLKLVPGSHRREPLPHQDLDDASNMLTRGQQITAEFDHGAAETVALEAGEAVIFHCRTIHGSAPNRASDRRINIQVEYCATAARRLGSRDYAALVRGRDDYGHFDPLPQPAAELGPEAFAAHREVVERRISESYRGSPRASPALD